jgi:prepilin-type N-terminal cleavage/methylation domain-containing protein
MGVQRNLRDSSKRAERRCQCGFTLIESIFTLGLLGIAAVGIMDIEAGIFTAQTTARDEAVGLDLVRGCAERLLAVRRYSGYTSVTSTTCNGMGGIGGFASNPTVSLKDATGTTITTCSSATCTATINVAKASGPASPVRNITLQLSNY